MASEIELKLELSPAAADEVARLPWLRELACGPAKREKLVTVYFDTAKRKLRGRGLSLRVRHAGKRRLQTIKTLDKGTQGAFGRGEWEREVERDRPDLALAAGTPLEKLATKKLKRKLKPVFETAVQRTSMLLRCDGSDVELAIDRGHVGTGGHRQPINEIELELKRGDPAVLGTLAERLARSVPVSYGARAKAERGYALSDGDPAQPVHAGRIALAATVSAGDAFTAIGLSCLKQIVSNQDAVRKGKAEGVHQMRIGLRRLRAAVSLFKTVIRGAQTEAIKAELKWLTDELGPAREVEVLIEGRVRPLRQAAPRATGVGMLQKDLDARRDRALERAEAALASERYRRLGLRTALWLAQGEWAQTGDPLAAARRDRPASAFAAEVLGKRLRRIVKKIAKLRR